MERVRFPANDLGSYLFTEGRKQEIPTRMARTFLHIAKTFENKNYVSIQDATRATGVLPCDLSNQINLSYRSSCGLKMCIRLFRLIGGGT